MLFAMKPAGSDEIHVSLYNLCKGFINSLVRHTVGLPALIVMMTISQKQSPPQVRNLKMTLARLRRRVLKEEGHTERTRRSEREKICEKLTVLPSQFRWP